MTSRVNHITLHGWDQIRVRYEWPDPQSNLVTPPMWTWHDGAPTAADVCHVCVSTEFENNFKILFKGKVVNHADDDKMQNLSDKVYWNQCTLNRYTVHYRPTYHTMPVSNLFLDMTASITAEAILPSKFKSELSWMFLMNFHGLNCASQILNPVAGASRDDISL